MTARMIGRSAVAAVAIAALAFALATSDVSAQPREDLSAVCFEISKTPISPRQLHLLLAVDVPTRTLGGIAKVRGGSKVPQETTSLVAGDFANITISGPAHVVVVLSGRAAEGTPMVVPSPPPGRRGQGVPYPAPDAATLEIRMVLDPRWRTGNANVKLRAEDGAWYTITDAPVRAVKCPVF